MQPRYKISQIFIYPIKSLGGIEIKETTVELRGLQHDRRWLLVDENNIFLTQRTFTQMAMLQVSMHPEGLLVNHKLNGYPPLLIPFLPTGKEYLPVTIWDDVVPAVEVSEVANAWFTKALGRFCRLVYMPDKAMRQADLEYAEPGELVSFADSFPILLIGQASLAELNRRLPHPVPMNRFRPNLVFTGGEPHAEDLWQKFRIGESKFKGVKPCARCVVTTIDQETGTKSQEPLRTLATYRSPLKSNKVNFGQNVIPENLNQTIRVGDVINLISIK